MALLSDIALSPELQDRYGGFRKTVTPSPPSMFVLLGCLASLPSPAFHALDPLAPYCCVLLELVPYLPHRLALYYPSG